MDHDVQPVQVIILDEADSMTQAAQQAPSGKDPLIASAVGELVEAMRRTMEIFSWTPHVRSRDSTQHILTRSELRIQGPVYF